MLWSTQPQQAARQQVMRTARQHGSVRAAGVLARHLRVSNSLPQRVHVTHSRKKPGGQQWWAVQRQSAAAVL